MFQNKNHTKVWFLFWLDPRDKPGEDKSGGFVVWKSISIFVILSSSQNPYNDEVSCGLVFKITTVVSWILK